MGVLDFLRSLVDEGMFGNINEERRCSKCKNFRAEATGYYCDVEANEPKIKSSPNYLGCTIDEVQKCGCIHNSSEVYFQDIGYEQDVRDKEPISCARCRHLDIRYGDGYYCLREANNAKYVEGKADNYLGNLASDVNYICQCHNRYAFDSVEYEEPVQDIQQY